MQSSVNGIITIDVEPDNIWGDSHSRSLENLRHLYRFHSIGLDFGVRPTYFVTWSVASDSFGASVVERLLCMGNCEVGIHPHLWETPPMIAQDWGSRACVGPDYPVDILEEKLHSIVNLFRKRFGLPRSHRAGRWGMEPRQIDILLRLGIQTDTSVTPGIDWSSYGAPDYTNAPLAPYHLFAKSPKDSELDHLIEIPCTIKPGWRLRGWDKKRYVRKACLLLGLTPQWLRVSPRSSATSLLSICAWARERLPHLNIMSHSSEFMKGGSPYWQTENDVDRHLEIYRHVFSWWCEHHVIPNTISEFADGYQSKVKG